MILYLLSRAKHAKFSQHLLRVGYNNPLLNVLCLYVIIPQCCDNLSLLFDNLFNSELSRAWHTSLSKISMELKTAGSFTTAINACSDFSKKCAQYHFWAVEGQKHMDFNCYQYVNIEIKCTSDNKIVFFQNKNMN